MDLLVVAFTLYFLSFVFQVLTYISLPNNKAKDDTDSLPLSLDPWPFPITVNLLSLGTLPHRSLAKIFRSYDFIIKVSLSSVTTVVISSQRLAKDIYHTQDVYFPKRYIPDVVTSFDQDKYVLPWMPISPLWRSLRRVCTQHLFSVRKLDSTQHLRCKCLEIFIEQVGEYCRDRVAMDMRETAFGTSLNLMTNSIFFVNASDIGRSGNRDGAQSVKEFKEIVWSVQGEAGKPNVPRVIEGMIEKRLDERAKIDKKGNNTNGDLLDRHLRGKERKRFRFDFRK